MNSSRLNGLKLIFCLAFIFIIFPFSVPISYGDLSADPSPPIAGSFSDGKDFQTISTSHNNLKKEVYTPHSDEIMLAENTSFRFNVQLQQTGVQGTLVINSYPPRARVYIGQWFYYLTPARINLWEGVYRVRLEKDGYRPLIQDVFVGQGRVTMVSPVLEPEFKYGTLEITSYPPDAKVFIGKIYYGKTPLSLRLIPGTHIIKVRKRGYLPYRKKIHVPPGQVRRLAVSLIGKITPYLGVVDIVSYPLNAKIFINGTYYGQTPKTIEFHPGEHFLELRHRGFLPYRQQLHVRQGDRIPVRAHLRWRGHVRRSR